MPGYVHLYADLVYRNTFVRFAEKLSAEDFHESFDEDHLIRTELTTLLGLMVKHPIDFTIPSSADQVRLGTQTLTLLHELHMALSFRAGLKSETASLEELKSIDFSLGKFLREPIFYTGESATSSQYRDLAPLKYAHDEAWIRGNRGFTIKSAANVGRAILNLEQQKLADMVNSLRSPVPEDFTLLPGFMFKPEQLLEESGESEETIRRVLDSFTVTPDETNQAFTALNEFNLVTAKPMLRGPSGEYILFQAYSFYQALYESPFYWMLTDPSYKDNALANRGRFTEQFAGERLAKVFGHKHTYTNLIIENDPTTTAGEIDNLVLFGNRAVLVQAKSKRLTLESHKGNDRAIRKDFSASIADSYNQALSCGELILQGEKKVKDTHGNVIRIPRLKKVYVLCLIADHYPALNFQVREFLSPVITEEIPAPLVTDVFTLDAMTEMLETPLHLLSYIDRRTEYGDKITANHEITILAYHLRQNLWLSDKTDFVMLTDDLGSSLDAAMAVRRDGVPGERTPAGILTLNKGTAFERLVCQIEKDPRADLVDLGFVLLRMGSRAVSELNKAIEYTATKAAETNTPKTIFMGTGGDSGITISCSYDPLPVALNRLKYQVELRKYQLKAHTWYGIGIRPGDGYLLYGYNAHSHWIPDPVWDEAAKMAPLNSRIKFEKKEIQKIQVGRNDLCPCGSGKKFKKCHMNM